MANNESEFNSFLGRGWGFPPTFTLAKRGVEMAAEEESVATSLRILLATVVGERLMQPKYGCNLEEYLFEPLNTTMKTFIKGLVEQAILYFEPRVKLDEVILQPQEEAAGSLVISINYTIKSTNSRFNLVFPFYLGEAATGAANR